MQVVTQNSEIKVHPPVTADATGFLFLKEEESTSTTDVEERIINDDSKS